MTFIQGKYHFNPIAGVPAPITPKPIKLQEAIARLRRTTPAMLCAGVQFCEDVHADIKLVCEVAEQHNLPQVDYENLVRDAMRWRKQFIDAAPQPSELPACSHGVGLASHCDLCTPSGGNLNATAPPAQQPSEPLTKALIHVREWAGNVNTGICKSMRLVADAADKRRC
jgi:hypothetical protein